MLPLIFFLLCLPAVVHLNPIDKIESQPNDALKLVFLIHRHGDRSPIAFYPRDPYSDPNKYWPDGLGQLTIKGKYRMFKVGLYLAKRYKNFLTSNPKEVHVRSSAKERCLQSTSMILAGIYPPKGRWQWDNETNLGHLWQPFPIETVEFDKDNLLNPDSTCKRAEEEQNDIYNSKEVTDYTDKIRTTLNYIQSNTGYAARDMTLKTVAYNVYDPLMIEKKEGLALPAWVDAATYAQLEDIFAKTFYYSGMTSLIQKLRAGSLLDDIRQRLLQAPKEVDKRLFIYSTHDTQLSVFLQSLGTYNNLAPPFGASILLEVHQNGTSEPYLKLFYLNVTESERPIELSLHNCLSNPLHIPDTVCTVSMFVQSIKDLIPSNWQAQCNNNAAPMSASVTFYFGILLLIAVTILLIVAIVTCKAFSNDNRRRQNNFYKMLPVNC